MPLTSKWACRFCDLLPDEMRLFGTVVGPPKYFVSHCWWVGGRVGGAGMMPRLGGAIDQLTLHFQLS